MNTFEWIFGIISGLLLTGISALFAKTISNEHRISVLETQTLHLDEQLDRILVKLDALLSRRRS